MVPFVARRLGHGGRITSSGGRVRGRRGSGPALAATRRCRGLVQRRRRHPGSRWAVAVAGVPIPDTATAGRHGRAIVEVDRAVRVGPVVASRALRSARGGRVAAALVPVRPEAEHVRPWRSRSRSVVRRGSSGSGQSRRCGLQPGGPVVLVVDRRSRAAPCSRAWSDWRCSRDGSAGPSAGRDGGGQGGPWGSRHGELRPAGQPRGVSPRRQFTLPGRRRRDGRRWAAVNFRGGATARASLGGSVHA